MMNSTQEERHLGAVNDVSGNYDVEELLFKILVIGDFGVGKTAIIRRYTEGIFSQNYKLTIGVDFALKTLKYDDKTHVTLQLWDIAGHERFGYMTHVYYKYAAAAIIVFDLSRPATLESVVKWQKDVEDKITLQNGQPLPIVLVANKCDMEGVIIDSATLNQFCKLNKIGSWFFTSAKENIHIKEAMEELVERIIRLRLANQKGEVCDVGCPNNAWGMLQLHDDKQPEKSKCCNT